MNKVQVKNEKLAKEGSAQESVPRVQFVTVTEKNEGQRVDNFLVSYLKGIPKSKIYRVIRKGEVRINKKRCKAETKLALGDLVRIPPVFGLAGQKDEVKISDAFYDSLANAILFEDDHVLVVNKPAGLAVHGGSGIRVGLIEALRSRYPKHQFLELVHRLDRDTSGCILVAKSRRALKKLHAQFRGDQVDKTYHLAVFGKWPKRKRLVDAPLKRTETKSGERIVVVHQDGKPSQTQFRIIDQTDSYSLLEAKPITGRTHQIRVHASFSGHPLVGDPKYQKGVELESLPIDSPRLMLHARRIQFDYPDVANGHEEQSTKRMCFEAGYDERFQRALSDLCLVGE